MNLLTCSKQRFAVDYQKEVCPLLTPQILKAMKLTFIFLTVAFLQISAKGVAQTVTLSLKDVPLSKVFQEIEKQTGYGFLYSKKTMKDAPRVSVNVQNATINDVLKYCFKGLPLTYSIENNTIVISGKPANELVLHEAPLPPLPILIKGKITDANGEPLKGATISEKGGKNATTTDANGNFSIEVENTKAVLVISFVGYESREIKVGDKNDVIVRLSLQNNSMNDVVVVGYGTQKKSDITGAISSVKGKDIENIPANNLAEALQGKIAGVTVTQGSGAPGSGADIIIRGAATVNGLGPLYIVDGVPSDPDNNFNIQDIQSVEVLKDAASASIYGVGAAGGVILVTTKHGHKGEKPQINFNGSYGVRKQENMYNLLSRDNFITAKKAYGTDVSGWGDLSSLPNTNWMKELYGTGKEQNYTLSLVGGGEKFNYYLSGNYNKQDGLKINTFFERYILRINSEYQLNSKLKFGENFRVFKSGNSPDYSGTIPFRSVPTMAVYDPANTYGGWGMQPVGGYYAGDNPLATQLSNHFNNNDYGFDANVFLNWEIIKGLTFRTTISSYLGGHDYSHFQEAYNYGSLANPNASLNKSFGRRQGGMINYTATYEKYFGKHHLKLLGGYEARKGIYSDLSGSAIGFIVPVSQSFGLTTSTSQSANGSVGAYRVLSQFGRLNYDYKGRYLLTVSTRRDGEDKFGPANRYGVFPSASAAWHISDESFIKNSKALMFISDIKLRGGYGVLGNDGAIGQFLYEPSYQSINVTAFSPGDRSAGWGIVKMPNADIKWEEVQQTDIGLDMALFQNKFNFTFDWYSRQTKGMLYNVSTPPSAGIGSYNGGPATIPENIGQVSNTGLEFAVNFSNRKKDFKYSIGANASFNTNKVIKLGFDSIPIQDGSAGDAWNSSTSITQVGHPMGEFYGYIAEGLFKTDAEAAASGQAGAHAGDIKYLDINKNGVLDNNDKTYIGNPWPKLVYAFNLNFSWKAIDIAMLFTGVNGVDIYNGTKAYTENFNGDYNTTSSIFNASFFNSKGLTNQPSVGYNDPSNGYIRDPNGNFKNISSYFVENGSYLKLKNLQIGYNLPQKMVQSYKISNFRIYLMAQNLFTITKYSGIDPELAGRVTSRGVDNLFIYPHTRLYSVGVNIGL